MEPWLNPEQWSLTTSGVIFAVAATCIAVAGWRLAGNTDRLADRTGLGEAVAGAVLLGAATSLSGIITSAAAAWDGHAELAVSNALGGIAAQTVFLVVADACYRRANLEHAAASAANIMQGTLLITLLAIAMTAMLLPELTLWSVHPATILLLATYPYGLQMVHAAKTEPMWKPQTTSETRTDEPEEGEPGESLAKLWTTFAVLAAVVGVAGWFLEKSAVAIASQTNISQTIVGGMMTAIATSLPELITSISAVRRGALTLAVSGIIGGNAFDTLFLAVSDFFYRDGSIYHAATRDQMLLIAVTILMTGVLLMGLVRRERRGVWNIGFESFAIAVLYFGTFGMLLFR
ncbi:MAG: sodium:calcium antiporter [Planctomycetes bacterium]|nr:sodium:calcium antiporter [Planctomycetota bacterium]